MLTRRETLAALLASGEIAQLRAGSDIGNLFGEAQGVAVVIDYKTKRLLAAHRMETARNLVAAPGSVLKPLTLMALIDAGKLSGSETVRCSGQLKIAGASFACVHPKMQVPLDCATAIAYSCNEFVARIATRFSTGELADALTRYGLASRTRLTEQAESVGIVKRVDGPKANQLQALGESDVMATALGMALAYHRLASQMERPQAAPILQGLEGAVEFGTAQKAAVAGVKVAGKTGSAPGQWAWFAGFAPSRVPSIVVTVLVRGRAGGVDAAPIGGRIIKAQLAGRL